MRFSPYILSIPRKPLLKIFLLYIPNQINVRVESVGKLEKRRECIEHHGKPNKEEHCVQGPRVPSTAIRPTYYSLTILDIRGRALFIHILNMDSLYAGGRLALATMSPTINHGEGEKIMQGELRVFAGWV